MHGHGHNPIGGLLLGGRRRRVFARLAERSGARPGDKVLDVGCGPGYLTEVLARRVGPTGTGHGVDASAEAIAAAQGRNSVPNLTFAEGDAEKLDAPDGLYDVVVTSLMLHHLAEDRRPVAIGEMYRVLRPGGTLLVAEFRPPRGRLGRRLIGNLHSPAMAGNRYDLLAGMVQTAGFADVRTGDLRPWTHVVVARKPVN